MVACEMLFTVLTLSTGWKEIRILLSALMVVDSIDIG